MPNHPDFDAKIAASVRTVIPDADAGLIAKVTKGVVSDPVWAALTWMDAATAEGALAQGLAEKAAGLAKAMVAATGNVQAASTAPQANDAQAIAAAFGMSMTEWRQTPPEAKLRLAAAFADKQAEQQHHAANVDGLKAKAADNTITPTERLTLARLTEEAAPTKAKRRDPKFIQAQQSRASLSELRKIKYGHDLEAASGAYPPKYREMHRQHSERIAKIIAEREANGET